jgi:hypothetical protein
MKFKDEVKRESEPIYQKISKVLPEIKGQHQLFIFIKSINK